MVGQTIFPITVDLMGLANQLIATGGKRSVVGVLTNAWRAQSCVADLRQAEEMRAQINRLPGTGAGFSEVANLQTGLMTSAVILYARATHTSGSKRERGSIQLDIKKMTPQQQTDHRALIRIRNGAVAHVEANEQIAGDHWHANYLFAKRVREGTWAYASGSTSIGINFDVVRILERQIPVATQMLRAICQKRLDDVELALREARISEATILRHQVDPLEWFGSPEVAQLMLRGRPGEESSLWLPLR
jgi:hypothetical protein